jgi:hypothetical protein
LKRIPHCQQCRPAEARNSWLRGLFLGPMRPS